MALVPPEIKEPPWSTATLGDTLIKEDVIHHDSINNSFELHPQDFYPPNIIVRRQKLLERSHETRPKRQSQKTHKNEADERPMPKRGITKFRRENSHLGRRRLPKFRREFRRSRSFCQGNSVSANVEDRLRNIDLWIERTRRKLLEPEEDSADDSDDNRLKGRRYTILPSIKIKV